MFRKISHKSGAVHQGTNRCKAAKGYCSECFAHGYCKCLTTRVTSNPELNNPDFVFDVKTNIHSLEMGPKTLREHLHNVIRDMHGGFYDLCDENVEVQFDLGFLETEDGLEWLKSMCDQPPAPGTRCHVRKERWEDFRAVSSILRAADPIRALGWGARSQGKPLL